MFNPRIEKNEKPILKSRDCKLPRNWNPYSRFSGNNLKSGSLFRHQFTRKNITIGKIVDVF